MAKRSASGSTASRGKRAASAAIAAQQDESAVDIELAEAVAKKGEDDPCPYDKLRNQNVARNEAVMMALGLEDEKKKLDAAAAASKPVRKPKTKRTPPPPREKVRASRLSRCARRRRPRGRNDTRPRRRRIRRRCSGASA